MKKLILPLILLLTACADLNNGRAIIVQKEQTNSIGICFYKYMGLGTSGFIPFEDSCKLYHIGDTIKSNK